VDYDPPAIPTTKTTCIHVVDSDTNEPLDSVLVEMTLRYKDSDTTTYDADFHAYSDTTGDGCVTYDKGSSLSYELNCSTPGYVTYTLSDDVNWFYIDQNIDVKLMPAAEMRLHVKNESPNDTDDYISILLPNDDPFETHIVFLSGEDIDTTFTTTLSAGYHYLEWVSYNNQAGLNEVKNKYFFERNTITDIEILF
jgi:hypothetical protein